MEKLDSVKYTWTFIPQSKLKAWRSLTLKSLLKSLKMLMLILSCFAGHHG